MKTLIVLLLLPSLALCQQRSVKDQVIIELFRNSGINITNTTNTTVVQEQQDTYHSDSYLNTKYQNSYYDYNHFIESIDFGKPTLQEHTNNTKTIIRQTKLDLNKIIKDNL